MSSHEVARLVDACTQIVPSDRVMIHPPDRFAGVPLCAIDAIFSIGVRYGGVENVVRRYRSCWSSRVIDAGLPGHTEGAARPRVHAQ
jgi:hypothetical protein